MTDSELIFSLSWREEDKYHQSGLCSGCQTMLFATSRINKAEARKNLRLRYKSHLEHDHDRTHRFAGRLAP